MIDISIKDMGNISTNSRRELIDFLLRTDPDQEWTTIGTKNNVYVIPGRKYMIMPKLDDRLKYRRELAVSMKDVPNAKLTCTEYEITVWTMTADCTLNDVLKTATDELKDDCNDKKFYSKSLCFILHTESNMPIYLYRLYYDNGERFARVRDPHEYMTEAELAILGLEDTLEKDKAKDKGVEEFVVGT